MARLAVAEHETHADSKRVPLRVHPRIFAALGSDLVTNDVVAVIELVKNSYDANASSVRVSFLDDASSGLCLEILDDGCGMTREIIEDVWCLVATPYKKEHPYVGRGSARRRVTGDKGLGRLSVARLGNRLHMITKASNDACWEIETDWSMVAQSDNLSDSFISCKRCLESEPFLQTNSGTCIRIHSLREAWDDNQIADLEDNLRRLVSPFKSKSDFRIFLARPSKGEGDDTEAEIKPPEFLLEPKYRIEGQVDRRGNVDAHYHFQPIGKSTAREKPIKLPWARIQKTDPQRITGENAKPQFNSDHASCGPFKFEIRAWDIGSDDTQEISECYEIQKNKVRKSIRAHKGISVYRDDVLVLPKSENARDWLGLDARRISKVGTRMSTSQIVGYVSITADMNPHIEDTSDRERLVSRKEVAEFEEILRNIVGLLEAQRDQDRKQVSREKTLEDLFKDLSADTLLDDVKALRDANEPAAKAVPLVQDFNRSLATSRNTIQKRFLYYSRLATIGSIAHMLAHEIRTRTMIIASFLKAIGHHVKILKNEDITTEYQRANRSIDALEHLADTFLPLASRTFKRKKRKSVLEEKIDECLKLYKGDLDTMNIKYRIPDSHTSVAVDPAELEAILLNLINNAIYWMADVPKNRRKLEFRIKPIKNKSRIHVHVQDTGPGVGDDDAEKVFWPGVTRKPNGIGMGLTVASELVASYGGQMALVQSVANTGASFMFDLPLSKTP